MHPSDPDYSSLRNVLASTGKDTSVIGWKKMTQDVIMVSYKLFEDQKDSKIYCS